MTRLATALAIALLGALVAFGTAAAQDPLSGTATLTANGNQTTVALSLTGAPANPQPAGIHPGTCANINPNPTYPLATLQNGQSTTTVPAGLQSLTNGGFVINVHKSDQEVSVYYACGAITLAGAQLAPVTGHAANTATLPATELLLLAGGLFGAGLLLRRRAAGTDRAR
jgi:hypothetical protein